jgi:hypothetical protein
LLSIIVPLQVTVLAPGGDTTVSFVGVVDVQLGLIASGTWVVRNLLQSDLP